MVTAWRLLLLGIGLWAGAAPAAQLTATVDRSELYQDEHLVLTLSLVNSDTRLRAEGIKPNVDLTLLTDQFDVGTPVADYRFNINRNHSRSTSEIVVPLFPRRAGALHIPPFTIDGLSSAPLPIRVLAPVAERTPEVFVRAAVAGASVWQREQLVVYSDLYHRVELVSAKTGGELVTEPVDPDIRLLPKSERTEVIDGIEYRVARNAWVMYPPHSGTLTVQVPDVWIETAQGRQQRFPVHQETVDVKPLPATVPAGMVVGTPVIEVTAISSLYAVGRMASWDITVRAPVLDVALPAELPLMDLPPALKAYASNAKRALATRTDGITGSATYTLSLIPAQPGRLVLPPIRFPYFDPAGGAIAIASAAGPEIEVARGAAPVAINQPASAGGGDDSTAARTGWRDRVWQALALVFAALWLVTLWRGRRRAVTATHATVVAAVARPPRFAAHPLIQRLLDAWQADTLEQGLARWERDHGRDESLRATVRQLQEHYYGKDRPGDAAALRAAVDSATARIGNTRAPDIDGRGDEWSPAAFTTRARR